MILNILFLILSILLATVSVALTLYFPILTGDALDLIIETGKVDFTGIFEGCTALISLPSWYKMENDETFG